MQSTGWGSLSLVLTPGADQMENSECGVELICVFLLRKDVLCAQSCLTLCNAMDCSPPGSSVQGTLQARVLEWVLEWPFLSLRKGEKVSCVKVF